LQRIEIGVVTRDTWPVFRFIGARYGVPGEVALDKLVHGSSPEEIHFQYPHLSLAQVYAALAYYYERQNELDSEIQRRWQEVNEIAALEANTPLQQRLRELRRAQ
jgi:uncharacterized protein (DUF433 family)